MCPARTTERQNTERQEVPSVSAGRLRSLFACEHRFASTLLGNAPKSRGEIPSLRLWSAINEACLVAAQNSFDESIDIDDAFAKSSLLSAPEQLSAEEAVLYSQAIACYTDAFGGVSLAPHPSAGQSLRRRAGAQVAFDLTGRTDLLFQGPDFELILRRINLRSSANSGERGGAREIDDAGEQPDESELNGSADLADVARAVLLGFGGRSARNDVVLRCQTLHLRSGQVSERTIAVADVDRFRTNLYEKVAAALSNPVQRPSMGCSSCEMLSSCPAIVSEQSSVVISRIKRCPELPGAIQRTPSTHTPPVAQRAQLTKGPSTGPTTPTERISREQRLAAVKESFEGEALGRPVQPASGTLVLNASRIRDFESCRRRFFLQHIVRVPVDHDESDASSFGMKMHRELYERHLTEGTHDHGDPITAEMLNEKAAQTQLSVHNLLCPLTRSEDATYLGGEIDLRWLIRSKNVLLTGRADALWSYRDGTLEVRDYKTGYCPETLGDDLPAAIYLLLAASHPSEPESVRVVYEGLSGTGRETHLSGTSEGISSAIERVKLVADKIRMERVFPSEPGHACATCAFANTCPGMKSPIKR